MVDAGSEKGTIDYEEKEYRGEVQKNPFSTFKIFRFIKDESSRERLKDEVIFAADWFEHPNVLNRSPRGESDFQAIRLIPLFYECYDALDENARASLDRFFLKRDFFSFYESENHSLMNRVSRYLASQFYVGKGVLFEQFDPRTPEQLCINDAEYINTFLDFRAKRGWGEFNSYSYAVEILYILNILYAYSKDEQLKIKTAMTMDIILLDMICNSKNGLYGGAHGRVYPDEILDTMNNPMFAIYCYYFGSRYGFEENKKNIPTSLALSDYEPSEIVYNIEKNRKYPYMNKERKHLNSCHAWSSNSVCWATLNALSKCSICKQTYVSDKYILGAINMQDDYPQELPDAWYAHIQQHEWELTLLGGTNHKIFSHHPGEPGYDKQHNRWTGDLRCCCSTHYTNENTAVSIYNITNPEKFDYINAYIPLEVFDDVVKEEKYIFLKYTGLYISIYFSAGYTINNEDEFKNKEVISQGRKHAVVLRVENDEKYSSMEEFIDDIHSKPVIYDEDKNSVMFDSIYVSPEENGENGKTNVYPYEYLYNSPYMKSLWNSGIIELKDLNRTFIYDFNTASKVRI